MSSSTHSIRPPHTEPALAALHRLLADANIGGQAKVDALLALVQHKLYVARDDDGHLHTINIQGGQYALMVFTSTATLEEAALHYGWRTELEPPVLPVEVTAYKVFKHVLAHQLDMALVDPDTDHAITVLPEEMQPFLSNSAQREASGSFGSRGRLSSSLIKAVKLAVEEPTRKHSTRPPMASESSTDPKDAVDVVTALNLSALTSPPPDDLIAGLSQILRSYPEVQWACVAAPCTESSTCTIGLVLNPPERYPEITSLLTHTALGLGKPIDARLLDEPGVIRTAKEKARIFYPWRS